LSNQKPATQPGHPLPFGAGLTPTGCRFSLFSRHATAVSLLLFDSQDQVNASAELTLDPVLNRTGDIWHVEIEGLGAGQLYLWRVDGPHQPEKGHRFNPDKQLIDPYAKAVTGAFAWDTAAGSGEGEIPRVPKCVVVSDEFDWQGDRHPGIPLEDTIIYETHVRGFTRHESSGVAVPGTFAGLVDKIGYFKELGITAVELLPVQEFNENEIIRTAPEGGKRLKNFWGYSTYAFFAPKGGYSGANTAKGGQVVEFKEMVRAFHAEGLEIILDVVFNHTAEGDHTGPTLSFRGLDNNIYYMLESDRRYYKNYSGCGNTLNCNHPIVRDFILDCLRYWVMEMHVDGFRFDLASILGRDQEGRIIENPPLVERIAEDPILRHNKIIAEAWDAAGAYQVGSFPGGRWSEWNGRYRDDIRRFWRGETFTRSLLATRITGSSDLYQAGGRLPRHSINFITCHDGFTLNDLVSYDRKHNQANGEDNRDGENHNLSWNSGVEGTTDDTGIEKLRTRRIKNYLVTLLLSQGVPMLLAGDEMRRTQGGNNNAYCQDNETSWIGWSLLEKNRELFEFTRKLIDFRKAHLAFRRQIFLTGQDMNGDRLGDVEWFESSGHPTHWAWDRPVLACFLSGNRLETGSLCCDDDDFYLMFNSGRRPRRFRLPSLPSGKLWRRVLDTAVEGPESIVGPGNERELLDDQWTYEIQGQTCALLLAR
jgi:isoamylase